MKDFVKILLCACFMFLITNPARAFYSDMDETHWAYSQIKILTEKNVVVGYPDGSFHPDENVTRAEFASMAIKALGQEHTTIAQPINYTDIDPDFWAYDAIQKAVYFDLISNDKNNQTFRPDDSVSRAESLSIAVNALTTEQISKEKAKEILSKIYKDYEVIPEWFIISAGKAEILEMIVCMPARKGFMDATRPATRAEVAAILFNMMEQAKLNPNAKLAEAMRKKTGEGYVIKTAYVQGSVGTIPAGSVIPVEIGTVLGSQISQNGDLYIGKVPQNYITKEKFILVYKGADIKGQVVNAEIGKLFVRNGKLEIGNELLVTTNDQAVPLKGLSEVTMKKSKFMAWIRKVFKGEKILAVPGNVVYVKTLNDIKVDLTNGWIYE
ncbi:S-layer homology domain-containing protein [bacterium]|nr:S-layer homology domain-containing protein [bacterium]